MGLFERTRTPVSIPLYTLSSNKVKLVVGLGNPGKEYDGTRHNIGFAAVDELAQRNDAVFKAKSSLKVELAEFRQGDTKVIVVKPTTFMNLSGEAVQAVQKFYKIPAADTIVVHDELDIPFGQIRTRVGGSSAGHNGVKSIIVLCGEDFARVRVGIKGEHADKQDSAEYVLQKFSVAENKHLKTLTTEIISILTDYVFSGQLPHETRQVIG